MSSNSDKESSKDSTMERNKEEAAASATTEEAQQIEAVGTNAENDAANTDSPAPEPSTAARVPFTSLSQVDSDMALARALQEQERAYFLLQMGHGGGSFNDTDRFYYGGDHLGIPGDDEEDQDDEDDEEDEDEGEAEEEEEEVKDGEEDLEEAGIEARTATDDHIDGANFDSDEAFARALQDKEDRDTTARLMALAGINDLDGEFETDSNDSQEGMWEDVDPDNMSYEELIALGEAVGTESKGLNPQSLAALQQFTFVSDPKHTTSDQEQLGTATLLALNSQLSFFAVLINDLRTAYFYFYFDRFGFFIPHAFAHILSGSWPSTSQLYFTLRYTLMSLFFVLESSKRCVVCRLEYEEGDKMVRLPCKHQYHSECIQQWLERNKVCPVCSAEVPSASNTSETKS